MPHKTRTTYETLIWRGITCRICTTHNWRIDGWTVITLRAPSDVPFPLGVNGYLSHGLEQEKLEAAGGAVAYFRAWADREAESPVFLHALARHRQGDLFKPRE
jgi:hypothetical protein